jgi:hypothetical protein
MTEDPIFDQKLQTQKAERDVVMRLASRDIREWKITCMISIFHNVRFYSLIVPHSPPDASTVNLSSTICATFYRANFLGRHQCPGSRDGVIFRSGTYRYLRETIFTKQGRL